MKWDVRIIENLGLRYGLGNSLYTSEIPRAGWESEAKNDYSVR